MSRKICVFCGSRKGESAQWFDIAAAVGRMIGESGAELVYGGAPFGLMYQVAEAARQAGAKTTAVVPGVILAREDEWRAKNDRPRRAEELVRSNDVASRIGDMIRMSDDFLVLPGGFGTTAEMFLTLEWIHHEQSGKKIHLLNIEDYWSPLLDAASAMQAEKFATDKQRSVIVESKTLDELAANLFEGARA